MFTHEVKKLPKNSYEIEVDIPWPTIEQSYDKAFDELAKELEVEGFRKGKAPKTVAEKHLNRESVYQQVIRSLFPEIYEEIIRKENLKPIISPRIELKKAKDKEAWELKFTLAEKPEIQLGDYKKVLTEIKKDQKKAKIWVPGKDAPQETEESKAKVQQELMNEMLSALLKTVKMEISDFVLEEELNSRLSRLVDDIQKIGMNMESYLQSKNITMEQLREQYRKEIEDTHKLELTLNEVAEKEGITVENAELEKLFSSVKDEKERQSAMQNAYFYAALLRKQKTLDFLLSL